VVVAIFRFSLLLSMAAMFSNFNALFLKESISQVGDEE
jgi:hypothetical protein